MFRCLRIEWENRRSGYVPVQSNCNGNRRMRSGIPQYNQSTGSYGRRHCYGVPCQRSSKGHGIYTIPSHRPFPSGRPSQFPHHRSHARLRCCLKESKWRRIHAKYDPRLSLAPRDIVARAIDNEMKQRGEDHVYLDVTHKDPEETKNISPIFIKMPQPGHWYY